jgi:hypothetical protein
LAVTQSEFEELRRLRKENAELRIEQEILRKAVAYFAPEMVRSAASTRARFTSTRTHEQHQHPDTNPTSVSRVRVQVRWREFVRDAFGDRALAVYQVMGISA